MRLRERSQQQQLHYLMRKFHHEARSLTRVLFRLLRWGERNETFQSHVVNSDRSRGGGGGLKRLVQFTAFYLEPIKSHNTGVFIFPLSLFVRRRRPDINSTTSSISERPRRRRREEAFPLSYSYASQLAPTRDKLFLWLWLFGLLLRRSIQAQGEYFG